MKFTKELKSNVRLQGTDEKLKDHEDIRDHASQCHDTTKDRECVAAVKGLPHGKTNLEKIIYRYTYLTILSHFFNRIMMSEKPKPLGTRVYEYQF